MRVNLKFKLIQPTFKKKTLIELNQHAIWISDVELLLLLIC